MKRIVLSLAVFALPLCLAATRPVHAYEKGGIAFILDHGKELNLTDDQKRSLNNMRTLEEKTRAKIFTDSDMRTLLKKVFDAKRKNDEAAAGEAYGEIVQKVVEKSAPVAKQMMDQLEKLLTPAQLAQIEQLRESTETKKKNVAEKTKKDDPSKPKAGTPPPNPFEF